MVASGTPWRVLAAALALVTAQGCWLQAGFDARRSGFNDGETAVTPATVDDLAPAWSTAVTGDPGEPLVLGGTAYVRAPGSVKAVDAVTGAARWTVNHGGTGQAVLANDRLWVPTTPGVCQLAALDLGSGAVVDTRGFGGPNLNNTPNGISVCAEGDALSVGSRVVVRWSYSGIATAPGPCLPNQTGNHRNGVVGADIANPSGAWNVLLGDIVVCGVPPLPVIPGPYDALSSDGTTVYSPGGTAVTGYPVNCPQNCLGSLHWTTPAPIVPAVTPLPGNARLAMTATDGRLLVVDAATGALQWSATVGGAGATGEVPPAVTATMIYAAASDGTVAAFPVGGCGAATCAPAWTADLPAAANARPSIGGGVVYLGGDDGTVTALPAAGCGAATCGSLWSATVPGAVSGVVIDGGALYVGSVAGSAGTLTGFRLPA